MMRKCCLNESFATVSMFTHSAVASLNNLEMMVYNYVIKNRDKVMYMTIRELADAAGVSTTTILRFCRKLNCDGYSEFRVRFKLYLEQNEPQQANFTGKIWRALFFKYRKIQQPYRRSLFSRHQ